MSTRPPLVSVVASPRLWMEGDALAQLHRVAALPGMQRVVGLPDLHPGAGSPIGAAYLADRVYPHLVGSDVGCGVAVWLLPAGRRSSAERIGAALTGLDRVEEGELPADLASTFGAPAHAALGTIGAGNHFLEVGRVDEVLDGTIAGAHGLEPGRLVLLVHTGSRGLGREILDAHTSRHGAAACTDEELDDYLARHDAGMRFARANRAAVAVRAAARLGVALDPHGPIVDLCHNAVVRVGDGWLHRKGAAPNDGGLVALPGSRGARSHLVAGADDEAVRASALWSVAHGAGRKFSRSAARDRFGDLPRRSLRTTSLGSMVICADPALLAEEAPAAYKDIEDVVGSLVDAGLVRPAVAFVPLATYKTERGGAGAPTRDRRRDDRARDNARRASGRRGAR